MIPMGNIIAQKIHETVEEGALGYDYSFDGNRDKNREFRRRYNVNDDKMKEILLELNGTHYVKGEKSANEEHPEDIVYIFKIDKDLMPRFEEKADYVKVCIYIKVTWPNSEKPMFIISFHEDEE